MNKILSRRPHPNPLLGKERENNPPSLRRRELEGGLTGGG